MSDHSVFSQIAQAPEDPILGILIFILSLLRSDKKQVTVLFQLLFSRVDDGHGLPPLRLLLQTTRLSSLLS
ncbi:hypothetical protein L2E82_03029 [Cichorium intybus]|uniref:Uncharacterized protein n=1 Tax=Cichorium intybus TaxID=13427 RepID=A0ACB9H421_CICIN|nr:hypothetical protein L2E82_03029 [Cichorium intybus]